MAIDRVTRVLVAVHETQRERLLRTLRRSGVLHFVRRAENSALDQQTAAALTRLLSVVEALMPLQEQGRSAFAGSRTTMTRSEFERLAAEYNPDADIVRFHRLASRRTEIDAQIVALTAEADRLQPWESLEHAPRELLALSTVTVIFGVFADEGALARFRIAVDGKPVTVKVVSESSDGLAVVVLTLRSHEASVAELLGELRFESVDLSNLQTKPADMLTSFDQQIGVLQRERKSIEEELRSLARSVPKLCVAADATAAQLELAAASAMLERSAAVSFIHGWVRTRDFVRLERIVEEAGAAAVEAIEPGPDEQPPVALVNRRIFRPFELVLELFSLPSPTELDPTAVIAPFFGVFFALCLTDAGYGLVVAALTLFLMRKLGRENKLLGMILVGALLTVPAGALVGGWFGDIPDRLGIGWLSLARSRLMWFDPVSEPMKFFVLSVALGYLQLITGIALEVFDCVRLKRYGDGLLGQLPWFVLINSLTARVLLARSLTVWAEAVLVVMVILSIAAIIVFTQRDRQTWIIQTFWFLLVATVFLYLAARFGWLPSTFLVSRWFSIGLVSIMTLYAAWTLVSERQYQPFRIALGVVGALGVVLCLVRVLPAAIALAPALLFVLIAPAGRSLGAKLAWGSYALYGATGYIGVVLSYIRLMALGMCTGGVAVAINVIAWMLVSVPVVGVLAALVVLLVGHGYNIAVNVLGAFVHSLRLQYVEFFPRFYTGGGEPFVPFQENYQFVKVKP